MIEIFRYSESVQRANDNTDVDQMCIRTLYSPHTYWFTMRGELERRLVDDRRETGKNSRSGSARLLLSALAARAVGTNLVDQIVAGLF
jgi:hypothetical protein